MKHAHAVWIHVAVLLVLGLTLGATGAPAFAMTVAPSGPTIAVGQTQQFTTSGNVSATTISAGAMFTCMRRSDGTVQCWCRNSLGQLGNGDNNLADSAVPVGVSGVTNASDVAGGDEHACALLSDGRVQCWGVADSGQLGDGTTTGFSNVPVTVSGMTTATAVITGAWHSCAVLADGTMQCWGRNMDGQLGNGTTTSSNVPVTVSGISRPAAVAAGGYHTCARTPDGTLRCWGRTDDGQGGNGTWASWSTPVQANITGAVAVAAGYYHTCALMADGTVQCWGKNTDGQLGNGTTAGSTNPVSVSGISNAVAVAAGAFHTCALMRDTSVQCWGNNSFGQLGDGTTASALTPVRAAGITGAHAVTGGYLHTCAQLADTTVRCWGEGDYGQLGNGTKANSLSPVTVIGTGGVTWTGSNTAVATIDGTGLASGVSAGSTTITATDATGASASSTLTVKPLFTLSVVPQGLGTGSVTSSPAGITCGSACSATFVSDTVVTLTATPAAKSDFTGWSGCDSVSGATCTVTMTATRSVTAGFALKRFALTASLTGRGAGAVTSSPAGITCGTACSATYDIDTVVTLTATPAANSDFTGWSGCDSVSGTTCTVSMSGARAVTAGFALKRFALAVTKTGLGAGTVTSSPAGINCGTACSATYDISTVVTLTATPAMGSIFNGWTGCDAVSNTTCTVTMGAARSVNADFLGIPIPPLQ